VGQAGGPRARPAVDTPARGGGTDVCALITRQEAAEGLGAPVPAGVVTVRDVPLAGRTVRMEFCAFGTEVGIGRVPLGSDARTLFAGYRKSLAAQAGYRDVPGLGDEAFAAKGSLVVRKGETVLHVDVGQARGGGAPELRAEQRLALLAVGRL
jgi:hypothetical protein